MNALVYDLELDVLPGEGFESTADTVYVIARTTGWMTTSGAMPPSLQNLREVQVFNDYCQSLTRVFCMLKPSGTLYLRGGLTDILRWKEIADRIFREGGMECENSSQKDSILLRYMRADDLDETFSAPTAQAARDGGIPASKDQMIPLQTVPVQLTDCALS